MISSVVTELLLLRSIGMDYDYNIYYMSRNIRDVLRLEIINRAFVDVSIRMIKFRRLHARPIG